MRLALLLLVACAGPATTPQTPERTTADNTCEAVTWSCVEVKPGTDEAVTCREGNEAARQPCTGRFALNPCLHDNVVAGCTRARGATCTTTWHAAPATRAAVEDECAQQDALFVVP